MSIIISPLDGQDVPECVRIELEAFRQHPRTAALWQRGYTEEVYAFNEDKKRESLLDSTCRIMKASEEDTGKIVGVSEWTFVLDASERANAKPIDPNEPPPPNWPTGGNWEMRRFFRMNTEKWTKEFIGNRSHIRMSHLRHDKSEFANQHLELEILVVNPSSHGSGIGTKLLSWGVEQAKELSVPICLESTPAGLSLYKRFGFEEKDVIKLDMKRFGWFEPYDEEAAKRVWMIREPHNHL